MKTSISIVVLGMLCTFVFDATAQDHVDALRFSQRFIQSDARSFAMGNAFGAVGANFISTSINPAGLALYRKSEFTFSTSFFSAANESNYLGVSAKDTRINLNLPEFGLVFTNINKSGGKPVTEGWASYSFGAGINRTNNFNNRQYFEGLNKKSSVLDYYIESANGKNKDNLPLITSMAYELYLIDNPDTLNPTSYISALDSNSPYNIYQKNTVSTRGSSYDINFSFAGNYENKVYIGGTLSFPTLNYHETREFEEINQNSTINDYKGSTYSRNLDVIGSGFKASLGMLVRPAQFIRFGASIESPTFYSFSSNFDQSMNGYIYYWDSKDNKYKPYTDSKTINGEMDFRMTTPFRATMSLAAFAGKSGFISLDYEVVDYSIAFFSSNAYKYIAENDAIENIYKAANNLRIGGELKFDIFALRAGYALYESPFAEDILDKDPELSNADGSASVISFGAGMREKDYFIDFACQLFDRKDYYLPYNLSSKDVKGAVNALSNTSVMFTFGMNL